MGYLGKASVQGLLATALCILGCSERDADRISKVSGKALDKANEFTSHASERIGLSIRSAKGNLDQLELTGRVYARLNWDQPLQGSAIKVSADKGHITLTGNVKDEAQRRRAVDLTQSTAGVDKVTDTLQAEPSAK